MTNADSEIRLIVQRLARRIRAEHAEGELSDGKRSILFRLDQFGTLSLGKLSEFEHVTPPSMNRSVGLLEAQGFVSRTTSPDDARKVDIGLTPKGLAFVRETRRRRDEWFGTRLAALTPEERAILDAAVPVLERLGA